MPNVAMPNKFLCCLPLKTGAYVVGTLMCCISGICTIVFLIQVLSLERVRHAYWPNAYAVQVVACIDCAIMVAINGWFLWAVKNDKSSVMLVWLSATLLWLSHASIMVTVLLILYTSYVGIITWIICVVLAVVVFGLAVYAYLCVYAYWLELRSAKADNPTEPSR